MVLVLILKLHIIENQKNALKCSLLNIYFSTPSTLDEGKSSLSGETIHINWRASLSMANILIGVKNVLEEPNPSSPANVDANRLFLT